MSESEEDFAALFEASVKARRFERGQTIEGRIVAIGPEVAFVDVGGKGEADDRPGRAEGPGRQARSRRRRPHPGRCRVHRGRARRCRASWPWRRRRAGSSRTRFVPACPWKARWSGRSRAATKCASPASARSAHSRRSTPSAPRIRRCTKATSTSSASSNSRMAARTSSCRGGRCSKTSSASTRPSSGERSSPGAVITGRVASVRDFGAFIDLGAGVQGLLHVSEMGWSRVADTSQVVKPGDEITVKVLRVDDDGQKIALGIEAVDGRSVDGRRVHLRGGSGAHGPRHARGGFRRVRRARARRRSVGARVHVCAHRTGGRAGPDR